MVCPSGCRTSRGSTSNSDPPSPEAGAGQASPAGSAVREETKSLARLHQEALAEGGRLVVYAGGDTATQQDGNKAAFEQAFPGVTVTMVVDYSKPASTTSSPPAPSSPTSSSSRPGSSYRHATRSWRGHSAAILAGAPHPGYRPIWTYPNANLTGFDRFMNDRAQVESFRQQLTLHVGEPQGAPSPGWPGTHPGR